ncbi:T9SS type A sorting domain-containing protein [Flammeovirga agarivorans]|uniref:T9SS type A sorting domain-containing protein n=1 Tax=Flammeovirga agarivorans TaxID=2726742 RepID=A0A7X8XXS3_9BACT|nr:T9SS type A sorting domain-containing protein [Flammeovirga agarivorans]NLR93365.1 T9SS type A sorting domain-containing protein [Flammeovirga agarivorans]
MKWNTTCSTFVWTLLGLVFTLSPWQGNAQTKVTINHKTQRFIGGVSELNRNKFFNLHAKANDAELNAFYEEYNVGQGRGFWGPLSESKRKGFAVGTYPNSTVNDNSTAEKDVFRYVGTEHPKSAFLDEMDVDKAADWAVKYFVDEVSVNDRPQFYEPMNEPFVHAHDFYEGKWITEDEIRVKRRMADLFAAIGKKIHETPSLGKMKVVGYSAAWPSMEIHDFAHWEENMKMFMDVAGEHMDGFSTHLYDGVNITGQNNIRSGSNSEAILDLIETYSYLKWGKVKPHAITEYGVITHGFDDDYTDLESVQSVKGINHMLFNLLDRENVIDISIPFITDKSKWHLNAGNNYQPYGAALFIPTNIGEAEVKGWRYSPRIHFYELWKDVKGKRVQINSDNPDIQTHAFQEENTLYIAFNNLDDNSQTIDIEFVENLDALKSITKKSLRIYDDKQEEMSITTLNESISSLELIGGETCILAYHFEEAPTLTSAMVEQKYYAPEHIKAIQSNQTNTFTFNGVDTDGTQQVILHMGIGRKHDKSKQPTIKVNDVMITVPSNWKGSDQAHRDDFFGVIEIPFDSDLLKANNKISVTFPDEGGHISSMILELSNEKDISIGMESVEILLPNNTIGSAEQVSIDLKYTATTTRDLVAEFWSSQQWLGQATKTIDAGSGTQTLRIPLQNAPTIGEKYIIKASIRPEGKSWQYNLATDQKNDVIAVEKGDTFAANFTIKDESEQILEGAIITIGEEKKTSNSEGNISFSELEAGEFDFSVELSGYTTYNSSFTISDQDLSIPVVLTLTSEAWVNAGDDQTVESGDLVTLTASTSHNDEFVTKWSSSSSILIENSEALSIQFTAPEVESETAFVFEFEGTREGLTEYDEVTVTVTPNSTDIPTYALNIEESIPFYPNPVDDIVNVELKDASDVIFFTSNGQKVRTLSLAKGLQSINISDLQKGIYFLKITSNNLNILYKMLKN